MPQARKKSVGQTRDYVTPREVDRLLAVTIDKGRHGNRNYLLILLCFRHGLRLSELADLQWRMFDFDRKLLRVSRSLHGIDSRHPLSSMELKALRKLRKDYPGSRYLFVSGDGSRLSSRSISRIIAEAGEDAGIKIPVNPRVLSRGSAHALARAGHNVIALQHYLGHRNILETLRYVELPARPFKDFWKDQD